MDIGGEIHHCRIVGRREETKACDKRVSSQLRGISTKQIKHAALTDFPHLHRPCAFQIGSTAIDRTNIGLSLISTLMCLTLIRIVILLIATVMKKPISNATDTPTATMR